MRVRSCLSEGLKCFYNVTIPKSYPRDSQEKSHQTSIISVYTTAEVGTDIFKLTVRNAAGNSNIDPITVAVKTPTQIFCLEGDLIYTNDYTNIHNRKKKRGRSDNTSSKSL